MEKKNEMKKVLLGLTTTNNSDWRNKIKEIKKFNIKEVALFSTVLSMEERKELYNLLEKTSVEFIPHVHLRDDSESWELDYLTEKYNTHVFNIHAYEQNFNFLNLNGNYREKIFVENQEKISDCFTKILGVCGGVCLDVSHYEDYGKIQKEKTYDDFENLLENYYVGCCHISAVRREPYQYEHYLNDKKFLCYANHLLSSMEELDYVKKYVKYLPKFISIELENSIEEQLEIKKYLENIIE